ncbi:class I SAM-dependent methyltransferase [Bacteroides caecimuris]|jgi:16S rRNA G966 N2-methylase RsmD|uniref:SAM-dependent methyltransferase n=1 Tax=Bacteroides caecimuris TaxID=1796613 RepID=A0A1C7H2P8_9BACE|nr:class I SAM-dependent methyltransferase [Bacteroides caecimuris]ANU59168.1 SAM-dependent methyltransferase [Bacteroides caecimuris]OXE68228.1 SAM-dependent methyltransferase [Bacteroides caecimuris]QQR15912.1 SAM-dependent methyltransferase [Bacteroides caecimuris]UQA28853.1 class I SAM-dependent methyltransferase [Bacteroides caecimuris]
MIQISPETQLFIREHSSDDVRALALQAKKYPDIDMPTAITQIAGRQVAAEKIPSWREMEEIWYPKHLSLEQCSSETTARYKARLFQGDSLTDLTGGFGIDCSFLAAGFKSATYVERQEELCEIAAHNFPILNLNHINVRNEDGVAYLQTMSPVDCIFLDPARRNEHGGKTVAISDCEPDVAGLEELLLSKAKRIMVKLSPMLDLSLALKELKHTQEVHILSVNNECKELLLLLGQEAPTEQAPPEEIPIRCANLFTKGAQEEQHFAFTREQEQHSQCTYTDSLGDYLYEPNASLLKAGAFRSVAAAYSVRKLHPNSHLYTSDTFIGNFPGRIFRIVNQCSFNRKEAKESLADLKKANVTVRNFPATVAELRKRLHLTEGGDTYLFASTLNDGRKVIIRCEKV